MSHSLGAKLSGLRHKGYITDIEYQRLKKALEQEPCEDCRNCKKWDDCECGRKGHINGTSIGYSIGECKDYEPCEDAVSRKALISHIENQSREWGEDYDAQQILGDIEDMPSVKPQEPKWIPVSERLPEKGYSVWVTRITDDNCKYVRIASYQGDCWMDNTDEFNKPNPHKVIAWQPLPTPYDPQERSDKE